MHPSQAKCHAAPISRPPAIPLLVPAEYLGDTQPTLPWLDATEVVQADSPVEPQLRQFASALMAAVVEVLSGQRSPLQLERWLDPELLALIEHLRGARLGSGLRLQSIRVQAPNARVLEVSAHLRQGSASRAAALRVALRRDQWVGTHLSIALRPNVVHGAGWISPLAG
ncbi:MAG TPA: Rv3235 family protein [Propionicimonas sp.]|nr:Rv3235 family protein [Propionicimonas sp.]HQA77608.1 Rv3235 family protein [Propionicimonas sp.]HQD95954.1 Rv3235 family protein [Propionicimonas sp.]